MHPPDALRASRTRTIFRENTAKFTQATGVQVRVDFVGWEDIRAADRGHRQHRRRARTWSSAWADDPHIYADKLVELTRRRRVPRQASTAAGCSWPRSTASAHGTNNWIGLPLGGSARPARVSQVGGEGGGLRHGPRATTPASSDLCQALKRDQQAGRLRARQRGRRRQRHANWLHLVARRLPGGRGRQGRHQQPEDDRRAELPEGALPHLRARHALLAATSQQPRLRLAGVLADAERRLAVLRAEERPGDARRSPRTPNHAPLPRGRGTAPPRRGHRPERHGVPPQPLPERGQGSTSAS